MDALFFQGLRGGGIGLYTHHQLQALAGRTDIRPELLCPPEFAPGDTPAYALSPKLCSIPEKPAYLRRFKYALSMLLNPIRLARHARRQNSRVVHFCTIDHLSYPMWKRADGLRGRPWSTTVHSTTPMSYENSFKPRDTFSPLKPTRK